MGTEDGGAAMQIRNLSSIRFSNGLWRAMAHELGVGGVLPAALRDPFLYESGKTLRVTVRPRRNKTNGEVVTVGYYTMGRINLFPCPSCSAGFMTHEFAHELIHAWLDQYHRELYFHPKVEELAERFADAAFIALGGYIRPKCVCGSYRLSMRVAQGRLSSFQEVASTLKSCPSHCVLHWQPAQKYGPTNRWQCQQREAKIGEEST